VYTYRNLQSGKEYELRVTVKDKAGNMSEVKQSRSTTKINTAPTDLAVSVTKNIDYFTVNASAKDSEDDEITYILLLGDTMTDLVEVDSTTDPVNYPLTALGLKENTEYWYRVKATDGDTELGYADSYPKITNTLCSGQNIVCKDYHYCESEYCSVEGTCTHNWGNATSYGSRRVDSYGHNASIYYFVCSGTCDMIAWYSTWYSDGAYAKTVAGICRSANFWSSDYTSWGLIRTRD